MKPKILFIITQGKWGGAQRYVYELAREFKNEYEVAVAVGEPKGPRDLQNKLTAEGIRIIQLRHLVRGVSPFHDPAAIFELKKLYQKEKPDLVHLNSSKAGVVGALAKRLMHADAPALVYTVHGWVFLEPRGKLATMFFRILELYTARDKDTFIIPSAKDRDEAIRILKVPQEKIHLIPHGIQPPHFKTKEEARALLAARAGLRNTHGIWVGTIASYYTSKGLPMLIEAAGQLFDERPAPPLHFFIIGDGPDGEHLKLGIKNLELEDAVTLVGFMEDAAALLPAFDIFILPSLKEGFPYVILEAMHAALPIIATRVGGVPDMIEDNASGLIVAPCDAHALKEALRTLADDAALRAQLGREALKRSTHFGFEKMVTRTRAVFNKCLARE